MGSFDYSQMFTLAANTSQKTVKLSGFSLAVLLSLLPDLFSKESWHNYTEPQWDTIDALLSECEYQLMTPIDVGTIFPYLGTLPINCLDCDGSELDGADYPELFAIIQSEWIMPDDNSRFKIPDMRGRFIRGANASWQPASYGGNDQTTLVIDNLPPHNHTSPPHTHTDSGHTHPTTRPQALSVPIIGTDPIPYPVPIEVGTLTGVGNANIQATTITTNNTGASEPFYNLPFFVSLKWCVRYA